MFRELTSMISSVDARFREGALPKGLIRHLDDEADLIVPLILERGEAALGVAHQG